MFVRVVCKSRVSRLLSLGLILFFCACDQSAESRSSAGVQFENVEVDVSSRDGGPWGKAAGDLDDDQLIDLIVGRHDDRTLTVYYGADWRKEVISSGAAFGTDIELSDVDNDGLMDIVTITDEQLLWYQAPEWLPHVIDDRTLHDIELGDLNGNGRIDVIGRNQNAFGGTEESVFIYLQQSPGNWQEESVEVGPGEGLAVGDINGDTKLDIVVNGVWFENRGHGIWTSNEYGASWKWPNTVVALGDLNGDAYRDILLVPSELEGQHHRVSWFENPLGSEGPWTEHTIIPDVEAVIHSAAIGDVDLDGDNDVFLAEMHQGQNPDLVAVYLNHNAGNHWEALEIDRNGSHGAFLVDVDIDGDLDIFGANWGGDSQNIELWLNQSCPKYKESWVRHVIDEDRPGPEAPFVGVADIDNDGRPDILTGGFWYKNQHYGRSDWTRNQFGPDQPDFVTTMDLGRDGKIDVLVLVDSGEQREFRWLINNGSGEFLPKDTEIKASGDFLQGVTTLPGTDQRWVIALSWHSPGIGVELIQQSGLDGGDWMLSKISGISQDEALSRGDIDGDGDVDLLLGTIWLRNDGKSWMDIEIDGNTSPPDRNVLADINGDGELDAVVGFEAISKVGDLVWYRGPGKSAQEWSKTLIGRVVGPMSVGVDDIDGDGDMDVVVGEHNLDHPSESALWYFENLDGVGMKWLQHLVYRGDEHHDGAVVVDIDDDGDLDIVSIGWGHSRVLLYENRNPRCP